METPANEAAEGMVEQGEKQICSYRQEVSMILVDAHP